MRVAVPLAFSASFLIAANVLFLTLAVPHGVPNGVLIASLGLLVIGLMLAFAAFGIWLKEYAKSR